MTSKRQLWSKGEPLSTKMHEFTVGKDPELDLELLTFDCQASSAHAQMLNKIGILSDTELKKINSALEEIEGMTATGNFPISKEQEDCHTAIETFLVDKLGDTGKKIHTGRSRNDQVLVAIRLYMRKKVEDLQIELKSLIELFISRYEEIGKTPMPGFTHMQSAMPSSVGMWLHAWAEALYDLLIEGGRVIERININPLGSAAGFGSGLPLDRKYTAEILNFKSYQRSFISCQNSRGAYEERVIFWCKEIACLLEKFASDVVLYCSSEIGFIKLPVELTTGSSIMPQKRNPDIAELLRASSAVVVSALTEISYLRAKLTSNYHRDFQLSKEPLIRGIKKTEDMISAAKLIVAGMTPVVENLNNAMSAELYATYEAYRLVKEGKSFRDAYVEAAASSKNNSIDLSRLSSFYQQVLDETHTGVDDLKKDLKNW